MTVFHFFFLSLPFLSQECVENLFLCLSSALLQRENQFKFLACEGFELLVRCMKEQEYAAGCAVSAVSYAIMRNQAACEKLVDAGGLKYVFPLLVGKGFKKSLKRKGTGEKRNFEETVISIIAQLCSLLANVTTNDYSSRLLNKFLESEREKLERCVELYVGYARQLMHTDARLEQERAALVEEGADEEEVEEFDEEIDSQVGALYCCLRTRFAHVNMSDTLDFCALSSCVCYITAPRWRSVQHAAAGCGDLLRGHLRRRVLPKGRAEAAVRRGLPPGRGRRGGGRPLDGGRAGHAEEPRAHIGRRSDSGR